MGIIVVSLYLVVGMVVLTALAARFPSAFLPLWAGVIYLLHGGRLMYGDDGFQVQVTYARVLKGLREEVARG